MVLQRTTEELEKIDPRMGGLAYHFIDRLVLLSKGVWTDPGAGKFFNLFISYIPPRVESIEEVRNRLQSAYWIEEEDVRQFCYVYLLSQKTHEVGTLKHLTWAVYEWLSDKQRAMHRSCGEFIDISVESEKEIIDWEILKDKNYSLHERYIHYCLSLGYSISDIAELQNRDPQNLKLDIYRIRSKYGTSKSRRTRKTEAHGDESNNYS